VHLKQKHLDALLKISNLGFGKAATSLSGLLQSEITLLVPEVKMIPFDHLVEAIRATDAIHVVVYLRVNGYTPGKMALFFPLESAEIIAQKLFSHNLPIDFFTDSMAQSALQEVGNIMVSSFLTSLADHTNHPFSPSTPALAIDMARAIIDAIMIEDGVLDDEVLFIRTLISGSSHVHGQLVFFPDAGSLTKLLGALV